MVRAWLEAFLVTVAVEAPIVLALTRDAKVDMSKRLALIVAGLALVLRRQSQVTPTRTTAALAPLP